MPTRLSLAAVAAFSLVLAGPASASPITYAFTGTLQGPIDGANQFSGSFTINGDPTLDASTGSVTEDRGDVSVSLKLGGQEFTFANGQKSPSMASFTAGTSPTWLYNPAGPSQDEILITGRDLSGSPYATFGMSFYNPTSIDHFSDLRTLDFNLASGSAYITFDFGSADGGAAGGTITSIGLVPTPTPEPSTLVAFVTLGVVAMARRRRR